jgi:ribosomal protein S18 acetylase RimI-like enzyme
VRQALYQSRSSIRSGPEPLGYCPVSRDTPSGRAPSRVEGPYRTFTRRGQRELRRLFEAGRGTWYVALLPGTRKVVGSCGIVVTDERGRYQAVDTALAHRRAGICSRLVVEAARLSNEAFGTEQFVIVADAGYRALGLYESLGFEPRERIGQVLLMPAEQES